MTMKANSRPRQTGLLSILGLKYVSAPRLPIVVSILGLLATTLVAIMLAFQLLGGGPRGRHSSPAAASSLSSLLSTPLRTRVRVAHINDDFCDKLGLDKQEETRSAACSYYLPVSQLFKCPNKSIFLSRIGDHVCDCCDGEPIWPGRAVSPSFSQCPHHRFTNHPPKTLLAP